MTTFTYEDSRKVTINNKQGAFDAAFAIRGLSVQILDALYNNAEIDTKCPNYQAATRALDAVWEEARKATDAILNIKRKEA